MASRHEVRVPDLGDFDEVEIVEVMVAVGDHVSVEDPLITLETDKAAMEVPSTAEGTIAQLPVATGMRVSPGDLIVVVEVTAVTPKSDIGAPDSAAPIAEDGAQAVPAAVSAGPVQVFVPDLGDFPQAEIIEVQARVDDVIAVDDSVITLETD
jgi:pyruvate dehydrogenase E2 component (dihydrolipoamide acetyltransferase)